MGDARGCRGGLRRGLRRCRAAPPLPLVVLPPDGVSTLSVCARPRPAETAGRGPHRLCPLTAPAAPASQMAAGAGGKSLRARCGVPLRPPCAPARRDGGAGRCLLRRGRGARRRHDRKGALNSGKMMKKAPCICTEPFLIIYRSLIYASLPKIMSSTSPQQISISFSFIVSFLSAIHSPLTAYAARREQYIVPAGIG